MMFMYRLAVAACRGSRAKTLAGNLIAMGVHESEQDAIDRRCSRAVMSTFQASMPRRYGDAFDQQAVREHAAIVARRRGLVHIEIWQRLADGDAVLCVVADDRPGLLSLVTASLVAHGADIVSLKAYTRNRPETGRAEAVDFIWVKPATLPAAPFTNADVVRIGESLTALVAGEATVESILRKDRRPARASSGPATSVTFEPGPDESAAHLTVETIDRPGLLLAITQALSRAGAQIVGSDATTHNSRVVDRFTLVERDGRPLGARRREIVRTEVLSAIEALARRSSKTRSTKPPRPLGPGE
jgi:[protein-PII] uridylyltransferase